MDEVLPVSVTVLLPTRNEEEALGATVDAIPRGWCESLEIMIVDGSSTDRTREIALEKDVRVHLEPRKGYGRAYRTGFVVASNDIIVTMDADCTYPAELIPELVKRLLDDNLDFITWSGQIDIVAKQNHILMSGDSARGNRTGGLLDSQFLVVTIDRFGLINLKRALGLTQNAVSKINFGIVVLINRSFVLAAAEIGRGGR